MHVQLCVDILGVRFERVRGEIKSLGDLHVGQSFREKAKHFDLTLGEWFHQAGIPRLLCGSRVCIPWFLLKGGQECTGICAFRGL